MRLYAVLAYQRNYTSGHRTDGFLSRAAAERFAAELTASGKFQHAKIIAYEPTPTTAPGACDGERREAMEPPVE